MERIASSLPSESWPIPLERIAGHQLGAELANLLMSRWSGVRKLTVRVGDGVYEELSRLARKQGLSVYEYVRRVIEEYVDSGAGGKRNPPGADLQGVLEVLAEAASRLEQLEERLARVERSLPLPPRPQLSGKPSIPEPTPENLRRLAAKLEQREVWPDEYPGNLTAGEVLLLDRLVKEGRAYYDTSTRRWRIRDLQ